jgi:cytochrome c553
VRNYAKGVGGDLFMRQVIATISAMAVVVGLAAPTSAFATKAFWPAGDGNVANGEKIFKEGKGQVPACNSCHGVDGTGSDDLGAPRLAGQFFSFIYKQLEDFAADKRQDTTMFVMNANAKGLTAEDRRDVATYVASLKPEFAGSDLEALKQAGVSVGEIYRGRALVEFGSPKRNDGFPTTLGSKGPGAPACRSCHDEGGRGAPPVYPMIGKQRYVYLVNQLKKWRDGSRANDPMGQMQAVARVLSDEDIENVAAYLTNAHDTTPGNIRTPYRGGGH